MTYTSTVRYIKDDSLFDGGKIDFSATDRPAPKQIDPESPVYARATRDFTQREYMYPAPPLFLGRFEIDPPADPIYALRLLTKQPRSEYVVPEKLSFLQEFILHCANYQRHFFPSYDDRFVYLTVRSGPVLTSRDDEFHVDGFQGIAIPRHIPEQNYVWASNYPTLFSLQPYFVDTLDPALHNFHSYFEKNTNKAFLHKGMEKSIYILDPYHVHARPALPVNVKRTLIRLTFSPVEIRDDTNTVNIWLPRGPYNRQDIRNSLSDYDGIHPEMAQGLRKTEG